MKLSSLIFASLTATVLSASTTHSATHNWSYHDDTPPEEWGEVSKICVTGKLQTPINIQTDKTVPAIKGKDELKFFNYHTGINSSLINNGHTVKVTPEFQNSYNQPYITVDGKLFNLLQFHIHTHSENRIDGKQSDLVAHFVHQSYNGDLAVVAVFFDVGEENMAISKYWDIMPKHIDEKATLDNIDISQVLPNDTSKFYTFMGSLTTPPCSENVKWFILKDKQTISANQIKSLRKIYPNNFRPIQSKNSRTIFER